MTTVITDNTDPQSVEEIFNRFADHEEVDIYSSKMSPIDKAIIFNDLRIQEVVIHHESKTITFILSNGTTLQRDFLEIPGLSAASAEVIKNFENMGNGVFWPEIPSVDVSLKKLIQEDLQQKYKLQIA